MTDTSHLRIAETPEGKGYGLFTERRLEPGDVIFETEAVFYSRTSHKATADPDVDECADFVRFAGFFRDCSVYLQRLHDAAKRDPNTAISEAQLNRILSSELRSPLRSSFPRPKYVSLANTPAHVLANSATPIHDSYGVLNVASFYSTVMNHDCIPNTTLCISRQPPEPARDFADLGGRRGRIQARALRHIKQGEELTISYTEVFLLSCETMERLAVSEFRGPCRCKSCNSQCFFHREQRSKLHHYLELCWQNVCDHNLPYTDFVYDMCGLFSVATSLRYSGPLMLNMLHWLCDRANKAGDWIRLAGFQSRLLCLGRQLLHPEDQKLKGIQSQCLQVDSWLHSCIPGAGSSDDLDYLTHPWLTGGGSSHRIPLYMGAVVYDERLSQASKKTIDWVLAKTPNNHAADAWSETTLSAVVNMFDFAAAKIDTDKAYEALLRELNTEEKRSTKRSRAKSKKKKDKQTNMPPTPPEQPDTPAQDSTPSQESHENLPENNGHQGAPSQKAEQTKANQVDKPGPSSRKVSPSRLSGSSKAPDARVRRSEPKPQKKGKAPKQAGYLIGGGAHRVPHTLTPAKELAAKDSVTPKPPSSPSRSSKSATPPTSTAGSDNASTRTPPSSVQDGLQTSPSRSTVDTCRQSMIYKDHVPHVQPASSQATHVDSQEEPDRTPSKVENDTSTCMTTGEESLAHASSFQQHPQVLSSEFLKFHYHQQHRSRSQRFDECDPLRIPWLVPSAYTSRYYFAAKMGQKCTAPAKLDRRMVISRRNSFNCRDCSRNHWSALKKFRAGKMSDPCDGHVAGETKRGDDVLDTDLDPQYRSSDLLQKSTLDDKSALRVVVSPYNDEHDQSVRSRSDLSERRKLKVSERRDGRERHITAAQEQSPLSFQEPSTLPLEKDFPPPVPRQSKRSARAHPTQPLLAQDDATFAMEKSQWENSSRHVQRSDNYSYGTLQYQEMGPDTLQRENQGLRLGLQNLEVGLRNLLERTQNLLYSTQPHGQLLYETYGNSKTSGVHAVELVTRQTNQVVKDELPVSNRSAEKVRKHYRRPELPRTPENRPSRHVIDTNNISELDLSDCTQGANTKAVTQVSKAPYQPRRYEGTTYISDDWKVLYAPGYLYVPVKGTRSLAVPGKLLGHKAQDVYRLLWPSVVEWGPYHFEPGGWKKKASSQKVTLPELVTDTVISECNFFADGIIAVLHCC
jgi:hypothetical protein